MAFAPALDQASAVVESARVLAARDWSELDAADALASADLVARARTLLDAAMVGLTARLEETKAVEQTGWASTKDFLTHLTGGHKGAGGGLIRAAEQLRDRPELAEALNAGAISLAQARSIAGGVATLPRDERFRTEVASRLLDLATTGHDASDLQKSLRPVAHEVDSDGRILAHDRTRERQERAAHHARFLSLADDGLGGVKIRGYCSVEDAETLKVTLMPLAAPVTTEPGACGGVARDPDRPAVDANGHMAGTSCPDPRCAHDGRDTRDHGRRMLDALVELTRRAQHADVLPRSHATTARIIVTTDYDSLREQLTGAGLARAAHDGLTGTGQQLSAAAVRRLACDAEIIPAVLGSDREILDVGRSHRLVTPALWNALVLRDQHCTFPGCRRPPQACDAHHLVHWADGGETSLWNLILGCRHHHVLLHNTPWTVALDPVTERPVWVPPPKVDVRGRFTYAPARPLPDAGPGRAA